MKKDFPDIGEVTFEKLSREQVPEAIELIYSVYQHEGIWIDFTKTQIEEEILSAFDNICYRPIFFVALFEGKMIGIASYMEAHISSEAFELSFGTILPEYQRKGLGTWLIYLRLREIIEKEKNAVIFTRARAGKLFEKFNFTYIYKVSDEDDSVGSYDYMFCVAKDVDFNHLGIN